ncbi:MAG: hypothetical protein AAGF23_17275, partial [Acidobacteriota bacterium]
LAATLRTLSVLRAARGDVTGAERLWRRWRREWPDDPELSDVSKLLRRRSEDPAPAFRRLRDWLRRPRPPGAEGAFSTRAARWVRRLRYSGEGPVDFFTERRGSLGYDRRPGREVP